MANWEMTHLRYSLKKAPATIVLIFRGHSSLRWLRFRQAGNAHGHTQGHSPFLSFLLSMSLLVQTCALPIPVAFLLISADAAAVTEGCETKTCCTALCYVDEHGVHHCVHKHSDSCKRGAPADQSETGPVLLTTLALAPDAEYPLPSLEPTGWTTLNHAVQSERYPAKLTPPPK